MEQLLIELFGQGKELTAWQMSLRTVVVFIICLLLIRLSGHRSFGMKMPFDNVITILLGAVLSRAVTGASPFLPIIISAVTIALLHRVFGWLGFYSKLFGRIVKGEELILYANGKLNFENMQRAMITEKDIHEEIRINGNVDSLEEVSLIYMERSGEVSVVKKEK